jgi:hypothetical protein
MATKKSIDFYKKNKTYASWTSMKARCHNKNVINYDNYGGRGITVCDEWKNSFDTFYEDMGEKPDGKSLDRIDVNKGYSKENCRWADNYTQMNNTTRNRHFIIGGKKMTISELAREYNIKRSTIAQRYYCYKWAIENCLVKNV